MHRGPWLWSLWPLLALSPAAANAADPSDRAPAAQTEAEAARRSAVVEVIVLHGTRDQKGMDARIGELPELGEPPFSSYGSYALLSRSKLTLKMGDRKKLALPNGRSLQTRLDGLLPKDSIRLIASIEGQRSKAFLPLLEVKARVGQTFIVAGQSYRRGMLVLVFRVLS